MSQGMPSMRNRDVVFTYFTETWCDAQVRQMKRPPDRLLERLMRQTEVNRLLVVSAQRNILSVGKAAVKSKGAQRFPKSSTRHHFQPIARPGSISQSRVAARRAEATRLGSRIGREANERGLQRPILISTNPLICGFADLSPFDRTVYYARDDWRYHPSYEGNHGLLKEAHDRIISLQIPVAAVSQQLLDRFHPVHDGIVIPNGVLPSEWTTFSAPPPWLTGLGSPRLVYAGTLDRRLDVGGLCEFASANSDKAIILVGAVTDPDWLEPLLQVRNVFQRFVRGRGELASILRACDVGLLPHRRTPLTEVMSPIKLYEYGAAGLPIVATKLGPVQETAGRERVTFVGEATSYETAVELALAKGKNSEQERIAFVAANSWQKRHDRLLEFAGVTS